MRDSGRARAGEAARAAGRGRRDSQRFGRRLHPALDLTHRDHRAPAAPDDLQLGQDVATEERHRYTQRGGGFTLGVGQHGNDRAGRGFAAPRPAVWMLSRFQRRPLAREISQTILLALGQPHARLQAAVA